PFHAIDHEELARRFGWFQAQTKLLFKSGKNRRGARNVRGSSILNTRQSTRRVFIDRELENEIELVGNACLVENPRVKLVAEQSECAERRPTGNDYRVRTVLVTNEAAPRLLAPTHVLGGRRPDDAWNARCPNGRLLALAFLHWLDLETAFGNNECEGGNLLGFDVRL